MRSLVYGGVVIVGGAVKITGDMMIFTDCPYCKEPQAFGWEAGMTSGWFPSRCCKCDNVMWVEATPVNGITLTVGDFKEGVMNPPDEEKIDQAIKEAINHSNVIYD